MFPQHLHPGRRQLGVLLQDQHQLEGLLKEATHSGRDSLCTCSVQASHCRTSALHCGQRPGGSLEDRNMAGEMATWGPQSSTDECSLTCGQWRGGSPRVPRPDRAPPSACSIACSIAAHQ